jgi:hypothetical protein
VGEMRTSHSVMALGTCETGGTGGTNVYWKLLMCEALRMALQIVMCLNPCYLKVLRSMLI